MNIVFLTGLYYPRYSAVGKCVKNLAASMANDHDVSVLSIRQWDSPTEGMEGCGGETLLFATTLIDSLKEKCQSRTHGHPRIPREVWKTFDRGLSAWRYAQRCCTKTAFHESIAHALFERLEEMPIEPNILIPCCGMFEHAMACVYYKRRHPATRLAPVLFDQFAFAGTLYRSEFQKRLHRGWNLQVEEAVLAEADEVFTITWEHEIERYHPKWLHKVVRIEHPLLVKPKVSSCVDEKRRAAVFAGSLDMQCRDPGYAIDLFAALRKADAESPTLDFFALGPGAEVVKKREAESSRAVRSNPPCSSSDIEGVLANAGMLVSIGNKTSDQKPSKQVEYMALGKPIVHIAATHEDAALEDLARYPLVLTLFESDDFDDNVAKLKAFVRENKGRELSFEEVADFFPEALPDRVASLIKNVGGGLLYSGSMSALVDPQYVLDLLGTACCESIAADFYIGSSPARNKIEAIGAGRVRCHDWVLPDELVRLQDAADCLLSIAERPGRQISSKIYEYLSLGKPIVHVYHAHDDVNLSYLADYPLALCLRDDPVLLEANARTLALWMLWSKGRRATFEQVAHSNERLTPKYVARQILEGCLDGCR